MKVGYGKARITPPLGVPTILGLEAELVRVLDDIFVRVVYIDAGGQEAVIAAADLIGLDPEDSDDFVSSIARATGVPHDHVVVHSIHTHQTANSHWETSSLLEPFGLADQYSSRQFRALVADGFVRAAQGAVHSARESLMCFTGAPAQGIASNRRIPAPGQEGKVLFRESRPNAELRSYPEGLIDPLVRLLLFKAQDSGETIGICNYNCHPTSAGGDGGAFVTGDYPGIGMAIAEGDVPGLRLLHLTGTCGEINPGKYVSSDSYLPEDRQRDAWRLGSRYATAIVAALRSAGTWESVDTLIMKKLDPLRLSLAPTLPPEEALLAALRDGVAAYRVQKPAGMQQRGPFQRDLSKIIVQRQAKNGVLHTQAAALRLGNVLISFIPGEIFLQFGNMVRERLGQPRLINAAYCFGSDFGYVVPPDAFAQGGYEPTATLLAPQAYDELADQLIGLLSSVNAG